MNTFAIDLCLWCVKRFFLLVSKPCESKDTHNCPKDRRADVFFKSPDVLHASAERDWKFNIYIRRRKRRRERGKTKGGRDR